MIEYKAGGTLIAHYAVNDAFEEFLGEDMSNRAERSIVLVDTGKHQVQRWCVASYEHGSLDRFSGRYFGTLSQATAYFSLRVSGLFDTDDLKTC